MWSKMSQNRKKEDKCENKTQKPILLADDTHERGFKEIKTEISGDKVTSLNKTSYEFIACINVAKDWEGKRGKTRDIEAEQFKANLYDKYDKTVSDPIVT